MTIDEQSKTTRRYSNVNFSLIYFNYKHRI